MREFWAEVRMKLMAAIIKGTNTILRDAPLPSINHFNLRMEREIRVTAPK